MTSASNFERDDNTVGRWNSDTNGRTRLSG